MKFKFATILLIAATISCSDKITNNYYESPGGVVFGNVAPVDSGTVTLVGASQINGSLDADGFFHLDKVPPGMYTLIVLPEKHSKRIIHDIFIAAGTTTHLRNVIIAEYPFPIYLASPPNNATGVYTSSGILLRCDEDLVVDDLTAKSRFEPALTGYWYQDSDYYDGSLIPGVFGFMPLEAMLPATTYRLTIDKSLRTAAGETLGKDFELTFTTRNVSTIFRVSGNSNLNRVSREEFRASLYVGRCTNIDSVEVAVHFEPEIPGIWLRDNRYGTCGEPNSDVEFVFFASELPLPPRTSYRSIISGGPLGSTVDDTVEFKTVGFEVTTVLPVNGYYDVPVDNQVLVIFNESMDTASARMAFSVTRISGDEVPGTFEWNDQMTEMMYSHWETPYEAGLYRILISTEARTLSGFNLDASWESYFQVL